MGRGEELDAIWPEAVEKLNMHRKLERLGEVGQPAAVAYLEDIRRENIDRLGLQPAFGAAHTAQNS